MCGAEGTSYENFVHNIVEVEVEVGTIRYMETLRNLGKCIPEINRNLCHIIANGMLGSIFEIVIHDFPKDQAMRDAEHLWAFLYSWMGGAHFSKTNTFTCAVGASHLLNSGKNWKGYF